MGSLNLALFGMGCHYGILFCFAFSIMKNFKLVQKYIEMYSELPCTHHPTSVSEVTNLWSILFHFYPCPFSFPLLKKNLEVIMFHLYSNMNL